MQDTDKLLKITPNMREVFKAVSKCLVILTWLRENLQGKEKYRQYFLEKFYQPKLIYFKSCTSLEFKCMY